MGPMDSNFPERGNPRLPVEPEARPGKINKFIET